MNCGRGNVGMGLLVGLIIAAGAASQAAAARAPGAKAAAAQAPAAESLPLVEQQIVAAKDAKARKDLETRAIETLKGDAPRADKERACRILKIIGTADAVPALAALLPNAELSHMARFALESMPCPEAGKGLREAIAKASGQAKVGVINSVGVREDAAAVGDLAGLLKDADREVAAAAAYALGRAGTPEAAAALADFRAKAPKDLQAAAADASLTAAERLLRQGKADEAARIYQELGAQNCPAHVRAAALAGLVKARPTEATQRLLEALGGSDPLLCGQAAQIISTLPGAEVTRTFAGSLSKLPPAAQAALVRALAARKDPAARSAVLEAARSADKGVRLAAVAAMGTVGSAAEVPMLVNLTASDEKDLATAAQASLLLVSGEGVNEALAAAMKDAAPAVRAQLLDAMAARNAKSCAATVVRSLGDSDASVRASALKALAVLGGKPEMAAALEVLKAAKDATEQSAARDAVLAMSSRAKEDVLPQVLAAMQGADAQARGALLGALGRIGGEKALAAVRAAGADKDDPVKDEAVRVLSDWPDAAAAPCLLELARTAAKQSHQVLGLRGYVRLAGQETSADTKARMLTEALELARRPDEKKLVLGAWGGVPTAEALKVVMKYLDDTATKAEAATAAVAIAGKLGSADKALVADAMKKVLDGTRDAKTRKEAQKVLSDPGK